MISRCSGIIRACADDLGAVLKKLSALKILYPIFQLARLAAGLELKPIKCNLVPLVPLSPSLIISIMAWLKRNIPVWGSFKVLPTAKYLGFYLGPAAGSRQWVAPMQKYTDRANDIFNSGAAISIAAHVYNTRVVSVPLYVAQLVSLPPDTPKREKNAVHKIAHVCTNALYFADFFALAEFGGPKLRSLALSAAAALFRTAVSTVPHWTEWKRQLQAAALDLLPLNAVAREECTPSFWDSQPMALTLDHAFKGFYGNPKYYKGITECINNLDVPVFYPGIKVPQLQKQCYASLLSAVLPSNIPATINKRIRDIFSPYDIPCFNYPSISALLKQLRKHDALRVIKTWVNSWATSYRMHEPVLLPCLFGCDGATDQLSHYVMCPILFALQTLLIIDAPQNPLERIGLINITRRTALSVSCTFAGYHAVRRAISLDLNHNTLPDNLRAHAHAIFVDHFWAASLEMGLQCVHERLTCKKVLPVVYSDGTRGASVIASAAPPLPLSTSSASPSVSPAPPPPLPPPTGSS